MLLAYAYFGSLPRLTQALQCTDSKIVLNKTIHSAS